MPFRSGALIERREVLHGQPWSVVPMRVVADTGDMLARRETARVAALLDGPASRHWWETWASWRPS
jgi:hypothetical protein